MIGNLPNRTLTYFNEIDYGETEDTTNTNIDAETIANTYLNKYGDTMHGALKINNHVRFSDNTIQTTAFNNTTVSLINDVIDRIAEIDVSGNVTQIPIIESDNIIFPTGIQTFPFTDDDKAKLNVFRSYSSTSTQQTHRTHYLNQTNLLETVGYIGGNGSGTQMTIVTSNNKPFVMDSDNYVDAWCPDFYVGRTAEAGTIHIRSGLEGDGARIYMNGGIQKRAFTDDLYNSILNSNEWNDQIEINVDDTVFTKPIKLNEALTFSDSTVQTTAFNPDMITDLSDSIVLNTIEIDDIKTSIEVIDDLSSSIIINAGEIDNIKTSIEVIDDLSSSIVLNASEIDDIQTRITGVNYVDEILYLRSDLSTNNNLIHTDSYGIKFNRNGSFIGKIGATETHNDVFYITSNDKDINIYPKSGRILMTTSDVVIGNGSGSSNLILNGEIQNYAFTDILRDQIIFNQSIYKEFHNNESDMSIYKQLIINSNFETLTLQGDKIIFDDSSQQYTAFTNDHASKLGLIIENYNGRYQLKSTGSGFDKIEVNAESLFLQRGSVLYGEIGALTSTNELHINSYNNKDIIINPGTADIQLLNDVHIGNELYIGGEVQSSAFTETHKTNIASLLEPSLYVEFNINWEVVNRTSAFLPNSTYDTDYNYDITTNSNLDEYTTDNVWSAGSMRLRVSYSMDFHLKGSNIQYMLSSLKQYSSITSSYKKYGANQGILLNGYNNTRERLCYNDEFMIHIENGDTIIISTLLKVLTSHDVGNNWCRISICQF